MYELLAAIVLLGFGLAGWIYGLRQNGKHVKLAGRMRLFVNKATADRTPVARIPAVLLKKWFDLKDTKPLPMPEKPGKLHRHPAMQRPERVRKGGRHGRINS